MRIEIISGRNGGAATISGFQTDYTSLLSETDSVIGALNQMKSYTYSMNGGLGILQNAVGDIDARIQAEESKRTALQTAQQKCNSFFTLVSQTDNSCAGMVSQNQEEFYQVNQWAAPSALASMMDSWYQSATKWLKDSARVVGDKIDHSVRVYTETDFSALSPEELKAYYNDMLKKLENGELSSDDVIRLNALMNFLKNNIDKYSSFCDPFTGLPPAKVIEQAEMYNNLYAHQHPDEAEKMKTLFANAPEKYKSDIELIKYTAYTSEGTCHDLFFKYADKVQIADYDTINGKGEAANYYSPSDMKIHINIKSMRSRNNHYGTFFHESGHSVDAFMAIEATGTDIEQFRTKLVSASSDQDKNQLYSSIGFGDSRDLYYSSSILSNGDFHGIVYKDVETVVGNVVNDYSNNEKHLSDEQKAPITDVLMGRKSESEIKDSNTDFAYRKVSEDITGAWKSKYSRQYQSGKETGILEVSEGAMLSEVMNGMSNNSVMVDGTNASHWWGVDHGTYGHSINWNDPNNSYVPSNYYYNTDGSYTGSAETEYTAEYMRLHMTRSESEMKYVSGYLPESWKAMDDGLKAQL